MADPRTAYTAQDAQNQAKAAQFAVVPIPAHTHNGTDSLPVDMQDLFNKQYFFSFTLVDSMAATAANYSVFFVAPSPMVLRSVTEVHVTKGSSGSAVTLQVERLTGTQAPGAGTSMLSAGLDLRGANNTVQTGTLSPVVSNLQMATGDRLGLVKTGTLTSLANVTVSLLLTY